MNDTNSIALVGFMGAGKSTLGLRVAKTLVCPFWDTDSLLEDVIKMPVHEIFETHGELFFRLLESEILDSFLQVERTMVVAFGGGLPCFGNNMQRINEKFESIYLKTAPEVLIERLSKEEEIVKRPLLKNKNIATFVHEKLAEREYFYTQAKHTAHSEQELISIIHKITGRAN